MLLSKEEVAKKSREIQVQNNKEAAARGGKEFERHAFIQMCGGNYMDYGMFHGTVNGNDATVICHIEDVGTPDEKLTPIWGSLRGAEVKDEFGRNFNEK